MGSPSLQANCTIAVVEVDTASSPTISALTAVGAPTSSELSSPGFGAVFDVLCFELGCRATLCGDCDGNGFISILDALLGAQHAVALVMLTGVAFANCDVDDDEDVDIIDSLRLAQKSAGLPVVLTCC